MIFQEPVIQATEVFGVVGVPGSAFSLFLPIQRTANHTVGVKAGDVVVGLVAVLIEEHNIEPVPCRPWGQRRRRAIEEVRLSEAHPHLAHIRLVTLQQVLEVANVLE
jgi:hypothetical protein